MVAALTTMMILVQHEVKYRSQSSPTHTTLSRKFRVAEAKKLSPEGRLRQREKRRREKEEEEEEEERERGGHDVIFYYIFCVTIQLRL